jgi:hypothetical protein
MKKYKMMGTIGKWIKKVLSWIAYNGLIFIIITICIIAVVMVYEYRETFGDNISSVSSDWGDFGSYLGAITGLLAFIGVLYSIFQSKKQNRKQEERSVFFQMLDLYQKQVEGIGFEDFNADKFELRDKILPIIIIYCEIIAGGFDDIFASDIEDDIFLDIYISILIEYNILDGNLSRNSVFNLFYNHRDKKREVVELLKNKLQSSIGQNNIKIPKIEDYDSPSITTIAKKKIAARIINRDYSFIYKTIKATYNYFYKDQRNFIGKYYRNIYYTLDMISSFDIQNNYSKIFRAQLSNDELILLFFNAVSSQSTIHTVHLLQDYEIFNNLDSDDILGYEDTIEKTKSQDEQEKKFKVFINNILDEFLKDPSNK